jgi:uncharacterized DUF497 family protein
VHTITIVSYEWDPAKARANVAKHGIYFADAVAALEDDRALTIQDPFRVRRNAGSRSEWMHWDEY